MVSMAKRRTRKRAAAPKVWEPKVGGTFMVGGSVPSDSDWHGAVGTAIEVDKSVWYNGEVHYTVHLKVDSIVEYFDSLDLVPV